MVRLRFWSLSAAISAALAGGGQAFGQAAGYGAGAPRATSNLQAPAQRTNPALEFFGRPKSMQYTRKQQARPLPTPHTANTGAPAAKPFSDVRQASAISPYLALDNLESSTSLPNYFLFVKPQLEMNAMNRAQQEQYWRAKQQQVRGGGGGNGQEGDLPSGYTAQFMNAGGYYPSPRR